MKKSLLIIILTVMVTMFTVIGVVMSNKSIAVQIKKENLEYEQYLGKTVIGTQVATLMNKVTEKNKQNRISKDKNERYIDNGENSIRIDVKMATTDEANPTETIIKTYPMETIIDNDILFFVQHFNLVEFKCTSIEYHEKTNRVSKIVFEEIVE